MGLGGQGEVGVVKKRRNCPFIQGHPQLFNEGLCRDLCRFIIGPILQVRKLQCRETKVFVSICQEIK